MKSLEHIGLTREHLLAQVPCPIALFDAEGHSLYVNDAGSNDRLLVDGIAEQPQVGSTTPNGSRLRVDSEAPRRTIWQLHFATMLLERQPVCFDDITTTTAYDNPSPMHSSLLCQRTFWPQIDERGNVAFAFVVGLVHVRGCQCAANREPERADADDILDSLGRFHHQIRIPLAAVSGLVGALAGTLQGERKRMALLIDDGIKRALRGIDSLLRRRT